MLWSGLFHSQQFSNWVCLAIRFRNNNFAWAVVVAQLADRSLPFPEVRGSNPVISKKFTKTKIKKKRSGMALFKKTIILLSLEDETRGKSDDMGLRSVKYFFFVGWAISRCLSTTPHPINRARGWYTSCSLLYGHTFSSHFCILMAVVRYNHNHSVKYLHGMIGILTTICIQCGGTSAKSVKKLNGWGLF